MAGRPRVLPLAAVVCAALAIQLTASQAVQNRPTSQVPHVPTPADVVDRMLALANVSSSDVVYDLGCGDGRIVVAAAKKYGARAVGFDIDPDRIRESEANAKAAGVEHLVSFKQQDILTVDLSPASVVTLYLLSEWNLRLRPALTSQLKPGSRIVSHAFTMGDWEPEKTEVFTDSGGSPRSLYRWIVDGKQRN